MTKHKDKKFFERRASITQKLWQKTKEEYTAWDSCE